MQKTFGLNICSTLGATLDAEKKTTDDAWVWHKHTTSELKTFIFCTTSPLIKLPNS